MNNNGLVNKFNNVWKDMTTSPDPNKVDSQYIRDLLNHGIEMNNTPTDSIVDVASIPIKIAKYGRGPFGLARLFADGFSTTTNIGGDNAMDNTLYNTIQKAGNYLNVPQDVTDAAATAAYYPWITSAINSAVGLLNKRQQYLNNNYGFITSDY